MAAIVDQKKDVFGSLAALDVLNTGMPKLPSFNSLASIDNGTDGSKFLVDLLKALEGAEAIYNIVVDTIVHKLPDIEVLIKEGLKQELKEMVACSINPNVPGWFQQGGTGVEIKVNKIDFFDMMKIDPTSFGGDLIYRDISSAISSKDFNTYLYYTIQSPSTPSNWGASVTGTDILETEFLESGTTGNNVLKFTTSTDYSNKKLPEFNDDYIDSLTLFGEPNSLDSSMMINQIIEELFGSISISPTYKKGKKQMAKELEIKETLECIINTEDDIVSDTFFELDNPTLARIGAEVNNRVLGIRKLETCGNLLVKISAEDATEAQATVESATTKTEESDAVKDALDDLADKQASFAPDIIDGVTVKSAFFDDILKKLVNIFMGIVISPKFVTLFAINHQIIYGQGETYADAQDFMKKNSKLVKSISKVIRNIILNILLKYALRILSKKLRQKFQDDQVERNTLYLIVLLGNLGVPPQIISQITKL